jgi:type II secretory pathway predicted ATPase ExeA
MRTKDALPGEFRFQASSGNPFDRIAMINNRFGLREEPFRITPTARFTYASQEHEEAYNGFVLAVLARRRLMALYGETGSGKTSLLQELLDHIEGEGTMVLAVAARPGMTVEDLIQEAGGELLHSEANGQPLTDMDALVERLEQRLEEAGTGVLIVDEAHELDLPVLYDLVDMASSDTETGRFLQVLLAGAPDLERMLAEPGLEDAMRRLGVSYHLPPLDQEQVGTYIQQRLRQAGADRDDTFEPAAVQAIAQYSGGLLQLVNTLGDVALTGAARNGERYVTRARIDQVAADLGLQPLQDSFVRAPEPEPAEVREPVARLRPATMPVPPPPRAVTVTPVVPPRQQAYEQPQRSVQPTVHPPILPKTYQPVHDPEPEGWDDRIEPTPVVAHRRPDRPETRPLNADAYTSVRPDPRYQVHQDFGRPRRWPLVAACVVALLIGAGAATTMMHPDAVDRLYESVTGSLPPWSDSVSDADIAALNPQPVPETPVTVAPPPVPQPALPPSSMTSTPEPAPSPATPVPPTPPTQAPSITPEEQRVMDLAARADRYIEQRLLTTPPGGNAFEIYQQINQIAPQHPKAAAILTAIKDTYLRWGTTAEERGQFDNAAGFYRRGLSVDPDDQNFQTHLRNLERKRQAALATGTGNPGETAVAPPEPAPDQVLRLPPDYDERQDVGQAAPGNQPLPPANRFATREDMIQAFQQPGMLQSIIQSGRDIDFELPDGKTALMLASEQGNASAVRQLLAAGAAPNARSRNGGTALMYAASIGSNAVVRMLLQSGSAVNSMNVEGRTALMAAAASGHVETVRILLENGANVGTTSIHGRTALNYAQEGGHTAVVNLLNTFDPQAASRRSSRGGSEVGQLN